MIHADPNSTLCITYPMAVLTKESLVRMMCGGDNYLKRKENTDWSKRITQNMLLWYAWNSVVLA